MDARERTSGLPFLYFTNSWYRSSHSVPLDDTQSKPIAWSLASSSLDNGLSFVDHFPLLRRLQQVTRDEPIHVAFAMKTTYETPRLNYIPLCPDPFSQFPVRIIRWFGWNVKISKLHFVGKQFQNQPIPRSGIIV